jgi:hypothetical protein
MRSSGWLLGVSVLFGSAGCTDGSDMMPTAATSTATTSSTATSTATPTLVASAPIVGLFREPRFEEQPDARVELGPRPPLVFPEHDGLSTVLYDTENGTVRDLGFGKMGVFRPDNRYMAWTAFASDRNEPSTLWVIKIESGVISDLGEMTPTASPMDGMSAFDLLVEGGSNSSMSNLVNAS